ncbi:cupredoxin domain-containing protein [Levilactobacillus fuyuanensis]|uniref:Cupredoxin domain-containing protein n=1 Tax=Levilactobacillus fuyuanensis TaxID=2486022 RepID=A0ABW4H3W4_9LACO|nr:cupredoxin domain-containing protein [Levilactobacillus fuyuanensis]
MDKLIVTIGAIIAISFIAWWFFGKHTTATVDAAVAHDKQDVDVAVSGGYTPSTVVLKRGIPAQITFNRKDASSCLEQVVFPDFGINEFLPKDENHAIAIDTSTPGEYEYACGMNMFHGKVIIK